MECPDCGKQFSKKQCPGCGYAPADSPIPEHRVRKPTCYTCGVVLPAPGYCGNCLGQTERDLQGFSTGHDLPSHPVNGDTGIYNGQRRVWVNGFWVSPLCAPEWILDKVARKATKLMPEKAAELAAEHAHIRATVPGLLGMDGGIVDETPPY